MPVFAYRGRGARGELVTGKLDAADSGAVADQLLNTGITPVDIRATDVKVGPETPAWLSSLLAPKVTLVDVMLFSRQMYTLAKAGVPILRGAVQTVVVGGVAAGVAYGLARLVSQFGA